MLRRLDDAVRDGDRILGVVRATHMAANGRGRAYMAPNAGGQAKALARLLERAAIEPGSIGYVESQATGSPLADLFDITGLARTVGGAGRAAPLPVGTLKSALGHLEAASGVAQVTKVLGMLERGVLMPTPGVGALHPDIAAAAGAELTVCRARAPWPRHDGEPPRRALVESFGAGGATAFAIIEEWQGGEAAPPSPEARHVVPLSARTATALRALAQALLEHLRTGDSDLAALAWTLQTGRAALDHRLACVAGSAEELEEMLEAWLDGEPGGWHEGVRASNGGAPTEPAGAAQDDLAAFWAAGGSLDWAARWQGSRPSPVALPTYPFEHRPYWLSGAPAVAAPIAVAKRRAVVLDGPADIDALVVREVPLEPPGEGEVQIRVRAFALNFADLLSLRGLYPNLDRYPFLPGFEVAGEVVAVGRGVQKLAIGDAVMALAGGHGGQADHVNLPEAVVALKPEGMGWAEAAASPIGYLTMRLALDRADLQPGETVLIQSAAGGTGPFAVQMAIERGATVIATAGSRAKLAMLRRLGVEHGIDYLAEDFAARVREITGGRGVDVVLNTIGGEAIQKGVDLLAPGGRYVEIAVGGLASAGPIDLSRLTANQSIISVNLGRLLANGVAARRALDAMTKDLAAGRIRPVISETFPFNRLEEAYRQIDERRNVGKVVVLVDEGELPAVVEAPVRAAPARPPAPAAGSIGPAVAAIVGEILALDEADLDPDRPLQEMGLSSVSGLAIMRAIQDRLGIAAPTTALWQHGSVRALTLYLEGLGGAPAAAPQDAAALLLLRERGEGRAHDPLVPIETRGTRPPSFWVHGAPGEVSWVVRLSEALGPDYPVFGIEAQGVGDGAPPQRSIARMAQRYVEAMRRQQPEGPYRLGGYSGGGVIAFEMVRQLQAAGQEVERLVLLDAWAPGNPALAGMEEVYGPSFVFLLAVNWLGSRWGMAAPLQSETLAGLGREAALERALDHLYAQVSPAIGRERVRAVLDGMERVGRAIGRALSRYTAEPLARPVGEVLMIRCAHDMSPEGNPLALPAFLAEADYRAGWEELLGHAMRSVEVGCDHFNLLADPFREEVARAITALDASSAASKGNGHEKDRLHKVVEEQIRAVLPDLPQDAIRPGVTLTELGATSIDRAEVASGSMEALGIVVPLGELAAVADVDELIAVLARHLPKLNGSGGHGHEVEGVALRSRA